MRKTLIYLSDSDGYPYVTVIQVIGPEISGVPSPVQYSSNPTILKWEQSYSGAEMGTLYAFCQTYKNGKQKGFHTFDFNTGKWNWFFTKWTKEEIEQGKAEAKKLMEIIKWE
jgi:hypothetical protein